MHTPSLILPYSLCYQTSMASPILSYLAPHNLQHHVYPTKTSPIPLELSIHSQHRKHFSIRSTSLNSTPEPELPTPDSTTSTLNSPETFPIEKRRRSEIIRERRPKTGLVKPEPPNFEIGWKRTKEINLEKPIGYVIADFLEKLESLIGKEFGSTELLAKAGEIVAERAREEAEILRDEGKVEERMVTELFRVLRLMEMDLEMVKASVKEETLGERLEQAKARCRQAILVAYSF
ncbi:protein CHLORORESPIRATORY REDUCTION 41, chloroplastic [Gastrolobium bilobum]|uniref:protein CHLORORESPIRATORY REDUCTION 41, chloroplastic n=1 Tax=Gastrolobium bilobum TaxID=150636 RepID=UPI002AAF31AB|nr:protein CHLORORESPIRATORY REDUCTION 41, chloroplastic [Gastrolobium bilobum]